MELDLPKCSAADAFRVDRHTVNIKNTGKEACEGMLSPPDEAGHRFAGRSSGPASAVARSLARAMVVNCAVPSVPRGLQPQATTTSAIPAIIHHGGSAFPSGPVGNSANRGFAVLFQTSPTSSLPCAS
jgi:hypothetical protein